MMPDGLLSGGITNIANLMAAAGGLGTAAYGLVDASKAVAGGMSNPGFGYIARAVSPFFDGTTGRAQAPSAFGGRDALATLRANWLNGVSKADQKAIAKSLIRLELTPETAARFARATGLDAGQLTALTQRAQTGTAFTPEDINLLSRFDAVVSAALDLGYERADQLYRNAAKLVAGAIAIVLAIVGGAVLYYDAPTAPSGSYIRSREFVLACLVGFVATPLAPIAKDLSSSLNVAVKSVSAVNR